MKNNEDKPLTELEISRKWSEMEHYSLLLKKSAHKKNLAEVKKYLQLVMSLSDELIANNCLLNPKWLTSEWKKEFGEE